MQQFLVLGILLWMTANKFAAGHHDMMESIQENLRELNASCPHVGSCKEPRTTDSLEDFACHCGATCRSLGTCCVDSKYSITTPSRLRPACITLNKDKAYFMVDRCPGDTNDVLWESLCQDDWEGESDVMKIVPVTSLSTNITYKNYFCFRCHEMTDEFFYWNVTIGSSVYQFDETIGQNKSVSLLYDSHFETWTAPLGKYGAIIPVILKTEIPERIFPQPTFCKPNVISRCSDEWFERDTQLKCEAYMNAVIIERNGYSFKYRNMHCALCNFENLNNMSCDDQTYNLRVFKVRFSFTHLLDINRSSGNKVGKRKRCDGNFLWDPAAEICRKLVCALPGYVVRDRKCQPP